MHHVARRLFRCHPRHFLVAFAAIIGAVTVRGDDWAPNLTVEGAWHSNVTRADHDTDRIDSLRLIADMIAAQRYALGRDDAIHLTAHLGGDWWPRYSGLATAIAGARAEWRHTFGVGALAPVFSIEGRVDVEAAKENFRSGRNYGGIAALRKRFNDRTRGTLSHEVSWFDARPGIFDRGASETTIAVDYDLTDILRVTLSARHRDGDIVSYATGARPELEAVATNALELDTFGRVMTAYRVDARTLGARLAVARALDENTALVVALEWMQSERRPLRVTNHVVSVAMVHQF